MTNGNGHRNPLQREKDIALAETLFLRGHSYRAIAAEIQRQHGRSLSAKTVFVDVQRLLVEYRKRHIVETELARATELTRIARLETTYWDAWERSAGKKGAGNPAYLQGVQWCIDRRCKILGIDAPLKTEQTGSFTVRIPDDWPISADDVKAAQDRVRELASGALDN